MPSVYCNTCATPLSTTSTMSNKRQRTMPASSLDTQLVRSLATEDAAGEEAKETPTTVQSVSPNTTDNMSTPLSDNATFHDLGVCDTLCTTIAKLGWKAPTPIQREAIPLAIKGNDIIGLAETGSGKTGSFVLPMLEALLLNPQPYFGLVLSPTRELAFQISEQLEALGSSIGVRCVTIVGGVDMMDQAIALAKRPHIIVASPGRIIDHLENTRGFHLRQLQYLVLDEADRLLNMDFEAEIDKLLQVIPKQRRTLLFSATMTSKVQKLQRASLQNPVKVEVSTKYSTVKQLIQNYLFVPAKYKEAYLTSTLNELSGQSTIIFCATCENTKRLALMLRHLGFACLPLHGKMDQQQRLASLNKFRATGTATGKSDQAVPLSIAGSLMQKVNGSGKDSTCNILICTDVASRGLDIPAVDNVINYDIPTHSKDYIHRVGRTARAGRAGRAITFVTQYDVELFQRIEQLIALKMEVYPSEEDAVMLLIERVQEAHRMALAELREIEQNKMARKQKRMSGASADDESGAPSTSLKMSGSKANYKKKGRH